MNTSSRTIGKRHLQIAAVLMACVLLVAAGWAAEKVYKAAKGMYVVSTVESHQRGDESPLADSSLWAKDPNHPEAETDPHHHSVVSMTGVFTLTDSNNVEDAKKKAAAKLSDMKKLIAEKDYEFVKTFKGTGGGKQYVYQFELSDGRKERMNFSLPLENVSSWEDYHEKATQQRLEREKLIAESIKDGRLRLIDVDVMLVHVCRDVAGEEVLVQRIALPDGRVIASARPPKVTEGATHAYPEATWMEHLQAIRDGKRELLDVQTTKSYSYEITLPDGSTTIFNYGGEGRLDEAKN